MILSVVLGRDVNSRNSFSIRRRPLHLMNDIRISILSDYKISFLNSLARLGSRGEPVRSADWLKPVFGRSSPNRSMFMFGDVGLSSNARRISTCGGSAATQFDLRDPCTESFNDVITDSYSLLQRLVARTCIEGATYHSLQILGQNGGTLCRVNSLLVP